VEFPKSIPNFFQNCGEVGILMEGEVGDIPGSVKDSTKDFGLEGLGCVLYWKAWHLLLKMTNNHLIYFFFIYVLIGWFCV
jgi:hypothetical protein